MNSGFPVKMLRKMSKKICITQNHCHPCVNCATTTFKRLTRDVYEQCCPLVEKKILIKGESNKCYNK